MSKQPESSTFSFSPALLGDREKPGARLIASALRAAQFRLGQRTTDRRRRAPKIRNATEDDPIIR